MTRSAIAVALWLAGASAQAQSAPATKSSSASGTRAHKRSTAPKPSHARSAAHEHAAPKTETAPKIEPEKAESARGQEALVGTKAEQPAAKAEAKTEAKPAAAPPQAEGDVRTEGGTQVKMMEFSGLDIEGQLKTPQMLYFLNRLRAEFGHPRLPHRSFMPELERSTKEGSF
jgi:hypothetical protein